MSKIIITVRPSLKLTRADQPRLRKAAAFLNKEDPRIAGLLIDIADAILIQETPEDLDAFLDGEDRRNLELPHCIFEDS